LFLVLPYFLYLKIKGNDKYIKKIAFNRYENKLILLRENIVILR